MAIEQRADGPETTREAGTGLQARVVVEAAESCPIAAATADGETDAGSITWSRAAGESVVEEVDLRGAGSTDDLPADASVVFDGEDARRVRFSRDERGCICDAVERRGCPVTDVRAERGSLSMTFYASDASAVRTVVADLRDLSDSVHIDRLARTARDGGDDFVLVDRGRLTDRQIEVLETALAMGYFDRPRAANATQVAEELGISLSTFTEHLATAQSKVLASLLDEPA